MLELVAESYPVRLHACGYGWVHPVAKQLIRKPTRLLVSHPLLAERLSKTCSGDHEHAAISGSVTYVKPNGENCTTTMSSYCNCHTSDFATAVLSAAQEVLDLSHDAFVGDNSDESPNKKPRFEREEEEEMQDSSASSSSRPSAPVRRRLMSKSRPGPYGPYARPTLQTVEETSAAPDDFAEHQAEEERDIPLQCEEIPFDPEGDMDAEDREQTSEIDPAIKFEVRRAHRSLGHCSPAALAKILRLGGSISGTRGICQALEVRRVCTATSATTASNCIGSIAPQEVQ